MATFRFIKEEGFFFRIVKHASKRGLDDNQAALYDVARQMIRTHAIT
jgi:hypothetical protein